MNKIVIIGCGNVGMSYAYSLVTCGANIDELALIDINKEKARGEAMDLNHALPYAPKYFKIHAGDYSDCEDATLIVIAAGRNQEEGQTRQDLIHANYVVFKSILEEVKKTKFDGIFLVATNPLDIMTYITLKLSGFDPSRVIGSGTTLDTARLRFILGEKFKVNPQHIHVCVLGEHGDSEFVAWDSGFVGLDPISGMLTEQEKDAIENDVRMSAYDIIKCKGNTSYGIGMSLLKITNTLLNDSNNIHTVSVYDEKKDMCYSQSAILSRKGVKKILKLNLSKKDTAKLNKSVEFLVQTKNSVVK